MPGFDGTGPRGMGPMTGGGRGFCNPYSPLYYGTWPSYGAGFGRPLRGGRGGWFGRGMGRGIGFGRGMGYPYAYGAGLPYAYGAGYSYGGRLPYTPYPYGAAPYAPYYAQYPYQW